MINAIIFTLGNALGANLVLPLFAVAIFILKALGVIA